MDVIIFFLLLIATAVILANIFALYWLGSMLIPLVAGGGPYVPTRPEIVKRMIKLARISDHDVVVDLGSGDGRLILSAMKAGAQQGIGYEISPRLVKLSKENLKQAGYEEKTIVFNKSMWKADLTGVTLVLLYQIPYAMKKIKKLLESQLVPGARVVSHAFKIPDWEADETDGNLLLYTFKRY